MISLVLIGAARAWAQGALAEVPGVRSPAARNSQFQYLGMFSSGWDLEDHRTGCQQAIDFFSRSRTHRYTRAEHRLNCDRVVDVIAGPATPDPISQSRMGRPEKIATDSKQRIFVTDGAPDSIHVFDFVRRRYSRIGRADDHLQTPCGAAVDSHDNLYVTDCSRGMILIYGPNGKFRRYIGNFKGERFYEKPTGIAIDRKRDRIYVSDTPRHLVFILDMNGNELRRIGKRGGGSAPGEFKQPADIAISAAGVVVLDALNFRVQVFDFDGAFEREIPLPASFSKPAGLAIDRKGNIYLTGDTGSIGVFSPGGQMLYQIEDRGTPGMFMVAAGLWIDDKDRLFVTDKANGSVQVFQLLSLQKVVRR